MMVEALLIAIAFMVYVIGYGLSAAALITLNRAGATETRNTDFAVLLLWPIMVPAVMMSALRSARHL